MHTLSNLPGFLLAASLVIIVPGPATLLVADQARQSKNRAAATVAGIIAGDMLLIALSAAGFAVLMQTLPWLLPVLRITGAVYLAYLGYALLYADKRQISQRQMPELWRASFRRGLLITVSNPKPILFFSSFFPLFVDSAQAAPVLGFALLGILFEVINMLYFFLLCCLVIALNRRRELNPATDALRGVYATRTQKACACGLMLCGATTGLSLFWHG